MSKVLVEIDWTGLALAGGCVAATLVIALIERLRMGREVAIGGIRAFAQLMLAGYAVGWLLGRDYWWANLLAVAVMILVATLVVLGRLRRGAFPGMASAVLLSVCAGALPVLAYAMIAVVRPRPLHAARYLIPIGSMVISRAMNSTVLVMDRLVSDLRRQRGRVEAALALGASARRAAEPFVRAAYRAGMLPTINTLYAVGLVHLPGMMTGQIIGGVEAWQAAKYQIVIMYLLLASAVLCAFAATRAVVASLLAGHRLHV